MFTRSHPRPRRRAVIVAVTLALMTTLAAQTVTIHLETGEVSAGQFATATVQAPAGTSVVVATDAPGVPPQTVVMTGSPMPVRLGPFSTTGDYRVTAASGGQQATAALRVAFPRQEAPPPASPRPATAPYATTAAALIETIDAMRTGLSRLPQQAPTIAAAKAAIDALQAQLNEIREAAARTDQVFDEVRTQLDKDAAASREAKDEFARLERELNQNLAEQARQVRDFGRDAERAPDDPCAAAMAVAAALHAQRSTLNAMRSGVNDLSAGHARRASGATGTDAAAWRQIKAKIEDLVQRGQAGSYAEAERSIGQATSSSGLGGYTQGSCETFTGEWRGTTSVAALHKGEPFYSLMNDWTAQVEIAGPRAAAGAAPSAERPLRGTIRGAASHFKVVNQLRALYGGLPATSMQFLTTDPTPAQQEGATFVAAVEGFLRGRQMTLKIRPGGVDYAGRVTGKLAAVIIAMGSPVPQVQVFNVSFMGGNWQLMRAFGPDGVAERPFTVTVGGDKRLVRESYPRTLSSAGARGQFTIDIRLCAGCD